jgi:hypothetical protein
MTKKMKKVKVLHRMAALLLVYILKELLGMTRMEYYRSLNQKYCLQKCQLYTLFLNLKKK